MDYRYYAPTQRLTTIGKMESNEITFGNTTKAASTSNNRPWLEGELRLSGIDNRMINLLQAVADTGSISQAAKCCGLSYKGAWQIIERANNCAPTALIHTATGGSKGGGAALTETGLALLTLFAELKLQHETFLAQLNQRLADNPDIRLLLQRLAVKTSIRNQLFGTVTSIERGAVNAKVIVSLADNLPIEVNLSLSVLEILGLQPRLDAVLLINAADIILTVESDHNRYSAANRLVGKVIRIHQNDINAEVSVMLENGEVLVSLITGTSLVALGVELGSRVKVLFKSNAPIFGLKQID